MSKIDKFKDSVKQGKKFLIIIAVLWFILAIVLVAPIACSWVEAKNGTDLFLTNFIENFITEVTSFTSFFRMFKSGETLLVFLKCLILHTIAVLLFSIKGFWDTKPKGKYNDIEYGSSDWSAKGEQYKVLSENKGIILAEDNYLPVDKRGNINTLIVGRFWYW
jgi:hypothetical protein